VSIFIPAVHLPRRASRQLHFKPGVAAAPLPLTRLVLVILTGLGGIVLDQTASGISTASINFIQGSFAVTPDEGSWVLTIFNAAYYTSIVISAWTATRFGRKRVLIAALLSFAFFSWLCAFAWNAESLTVLRGLQGFALGSIFVPAVISILVSVAPEKIGYVFLPFTFASLSASTVGIMLGGIFVQYAEWQDVFVVTSVFAILVAVVGWFALPPDRDAKRRPFDYAGMLPLLVAFLAFQYVVNEGERRDYFNDPSIVFATFLMVASIAAFIVWKLRLSRHPFINLKVVGKPAVALGTICAAMLSVAQYSGTVLVQYAQAAGTAFSPTDAGALFALRIVTFAIAIPGIGLLVVTKKLNPRVALTIAFASFAVLTLLQADKMTSTADFGTFVILALFLGLAQGAANQPLPLLIFGSLTRAEFPTGALVYKMGPVLGTAIAGAIVQRLFEVRSAQNLSDLAGSITLDRPDVASFVSHGSAHTLAALVNQEASVLAYDDITRVLAIVAALIIPIIFIIKLPGTSPKTRAAVASE
jgi:DHA2 family multidrug resistance protein